MDGLLVVDKPTGLSSHDVVARVRRAIREPRVGHTGTLDPEASGVLPLVLGRATRLARFLSTDHKTYEAVVRLGFSTNTCDAAGTRVGLQHEGPMPSRATIESALDRYRGEFLQKPPAYSAKKIGGKRSYKIARRADRGDGGAAAQTALDEIAPATVSTSALELVAYEEDRLTLHLTCSAGFYVRSLAYDLGQDLGTGAHLAGLRRTSCGSATVANAIPLAEIEDRASGLDKATAALIPLAVMLPDLPTLTVTEAAIRLVANGRELGPTAFQNPADFTRLASRFATEIQGAGGNQARIRLISAGGQLVALASRRPSGLLHPFVVLM